MQYLAQWRMQIAATLLASESGNIRRVAAQVGYDSGAAFSRTFKKLVGMPPCRLAQEPGGQSTLSPACPWRRRNCISTRPSA